MNISEQSRGFVAAARSAPSAGRQGQMGWNWVTFAVDGQQFSTDQLGNYTYYPSASVTRIEPPNALVSHGAVTLTVHGHNFLPPQATGSDQSNASNQSNATVTSSISRDAWYAECRFGSVVVQAHVNTSQKIMCTG